MTTQKYLLTITKNADSHPEQLRLATNDPDDLKTLLNKYWYWRCDPLRLMPLLLSLSTILGLLLALPFMAVAVVCHFVVEGCWFIIQGTKVLSDNYTILDKEIETVTPRKD